MAIVVKHAIVRLNHLRHFPPRRTNDADKICEESPTLTQVQQIWSEVLKRRVVTQVVVVGTIYVSENTCVY